MAFLTDVSLGYLVFNLFPDFFSRAYKILNLGDTIATHFGDFSGQVYFIFIPIFLVRVCSTLLLGVSFGQFFCGIRGEGRGFLTRLAGVGRVFLELITMPLFILELPPLWKKRTLGEVLTATRLVSKGGGLLFRFVGFPILPIVAVLSPLLQSLTSSGMTKISFSHQNLDNALDLQRIAAERTMDTHKKVLYSSNYFRMQTDAYLEDGRFILLPSIEVIKRKKQKKIKPFLTIYDTLENKVATLTIKRTLPFLSLLKKGENGNPIFKYYYPKLYKDLNKKLSHDKRISYEYHYGKEGLLSIDTRREISLLVGDALNIGSSNIWIHSITKGPFVRGYFDLRQALFSIVGAEVPPTIELISLGNRKFLRFHQEYPHQRFPVQESLVSIGTHNALVFEWLSEAESKKSREEFIKRFFARTQWYFDFKDIFPFPQNGEKFNIFHVMDYFLREDLLSGQRRPLENFIIEYYSKMVAAALETKNSKLQKILLVDLERYQMVVDIVELEISKSFLQQTYALQTKLLSVSDKRLR